MKIAAYALLALATLATTAHADVKLMVDNNIKITAINGQEIRHGALQPLKREFNLQAGRHVITARYDRLFDLPRGDHDYLKSMNVTITADLDDNQSYQLIMPNQPNNYKDAKEFVKAPTLAITQNGKVIAEQKNVGERSGGIVSSIGASISGLFNRGDNAVAANQQAMAAINTAPPAQNTTPTSLPAGKSQDNLDGFMQLWLNASEEEREKIRQWVQK